MNWPLTLSLRRKLTLVIMINTVVALCAASLGFAEYGVYRFKELRLEDLNALANILGTNSTAPLEFKDPNSARDILQALAAKPHILSAVIYDRDGNPFAAYHRGGAPGGYVPPPVETDSSRFTANRVLIFQTVVFEEEKVGTVFLEGDTVEYRQLLDGYLFFFALIVAAVSLGAYAMAGRLQRPISDPILELAWTTKMVTSSRDYSIRAAKRSGDEVGVLIDGFNEMLSQIQKRDDELLHASQDLERRVEERTVELEQEVSDRQRAQEALHESEGRIRLLLDSTAEAIYGIDESGAITFCNPATLRLLGYDRGESLLGRPGHDVMHHSRADGSVYPLAECPIVDSRLRGEGVHSDSEVFWRSDGTCFPVEYWAYPIRKEGEVVGAVVTFLDITVRRRAQAALLEAKEAAEAASRAKSEFLANMSHEIRTPMNGILGMTELALDTRLSHEQRDYLTLVKSSADSLLHVINDILDFSKIEAGKLELEKTEFEIRDLFRDTLKALVQRVGGKPLELCSRIAPQVPRVLVGDPTRLRQLIVNLVGNAIKFTQEGNVVVDTELESTSGDEVRLHVSVKDSGIGIPLDKQRIVFESFAQADGSTTRRFGGTGLGLTISRQLVELMGGRLWLESEVGKGSTFHFTCNLQQGTSLPTERELTAGRSLPGLKVLVVDNNPINREILAEMLGNWRMNPTLADGGAAALNLLDSAQRSGHPFSLVLLDALMPNVDGFEVLQRIQENPKLAGAVVLMVSANRCLVDPEHCRKSGVKHWVTKPAGQSELLDAILSALGVTVAEKKLVEPSLPALQTQAQKGRSLNLLLSEDNLVNQKLAIRLLEKAGHRVTLASTGLEAVAAWEQAGVPGFDAILMDIQMPEMDGREATAEIRRREAVSGRHVPIVAMTAHAMRGDKEKYLASGMDGYVSKPVHPAELFAEIARCLGAPEGSDTMAEKSSQGTGQFDRASLLERVEGDRELLAEMIRMFRQDAPNLVGAMRIALERADMTALERSAHSLKGAASNLSAGAAAAAAAQLEKAAKDKDPAAAKAGLADVEQALKQLLPALAELVEGVSK